MPKISAHHVIFRDASRYSTFPWAERLDDGRIVVVFRQADAFSAEAAKQGKVTHHDAASWIACVTSRDEGRSWPASSYRVLYKSKYGVNDPAVTALRDGRLVLRVTEIDVRSTEERGKLPGALTSHRVEHGRVASARGNVTAFVDVGSTNAVNGGQLVEAAEYTRSFSREPVIELPDGSWVLSVYLGAPFRTDSAFLLRSYDKGKSWGDASVILHDRAAGPSDQQGTNFNETSVTSFGDGEMLAVGRADDSFHSEGSYIPVGGVGELYTARSYNWGLSWTSPAKTGIFGQPAHVLHLGDGRLICTFGYRRAPFGVRVMQSRDRGRTWDADGTFVLRDDAPTWDVGYPMTLPLSEGSFLSVYYFTDADGVRHIAGTSWTL